MIAIIPARGGSKRVKNKNIIDFFGHPMLAYTIEAAKNSNVFQDVYVSTEDKKIAEVALHYGAKLINRLPNLADDNASLADVCIDAVNQLDKQNIQFNRFCQLMPNCPLRNSKDIIQHYNEFIESDFSFQISAVNYRGVYPHWALVKEESWQWLLGRENLTNSQNLKQAVCPTGAMWFVKTKSFLRECAFYGNNFQVKLMDPNRGIDIDTLEDLQLAKLITRGLESSPLESIKVKPWRESE